MQKRFLFSVIVSFALAGSHSQALAGFESQTVDSNSHIALDSQQLNQLDIIDNWIRTGQWHSVSTTLPPLLNQAETLANPALKAELLLRLGHLHRAEQKTAQALQDYQQAQTLAAQINDKALEAAALINSHQVNAQLALLTQAQQLINQLPQDNIKNRLHLALGHQAVQQHQSQMAFEVLNPLVEHPTDNREKSEALSLLAETYWQQQRSKEALVLNEQALLSDSSPDLLMQNQWQRARFLSAQKQKTAALDAYRQAVAYLQQIKQDVPIVYPNGQSSFAATYSPLYLSYLDLLIEQSEHEPSQQQALLQEAVQTWEQLKTVELQDYFRDACSIQQTSSDLAPIEPQSAVIYPILMPDHSDLLVRYANHISAYRIPQGQTQIHQQVNALISAIESFKPAPQAHSLYDALIKPLQAELQQQNITTLIYLPDGALRQIPLGLLHDGQQYLIERYAIATIPGLSLLTQPLLQKNKHDIVLAGMSQPGPVVDELLRSNINLFAPVEENRSLGNARRGLVLQNSTDSDRGLTEGNERALRAQQLQEDLALPGVSVELQNLAHLSEVPALENEQFQRETFIQRVNEGHSLIHIASHGFFSGDPDQSFIMAYDKLITMQQLSQIFKTEAFSERPVDLVTLSACQTAEGDDRSPLGLSGVVLQTGVKSVVGTLWPVADEAALQFFSEFYKHYQQPGENKAQALQHAQVQLLKQENMQHPLFWAPFILVGEWR